MTPMDLEAATDLLRAHVPGLRVAWLHGSRARGDARDDSDVDLAIYADGPLGLHALLPLQADLAALLGAEVDVVDLWTADDVLRLQVIEHGRVLFERTAADRARVEMHAL
jgi:predicted nucleotidyltransferase